MMTDAAKKSDSQKVSRRAWLMVAVFGLLIAGGIFWIFQDAEPPDDSWILPIRKAPIKGGNPLEIFCRDIELHSIGGVQKLFEPVHGDLKKVPSADLSIFLEGNLPQAAIFDHLMLSDPATWCWPDAQKPPSLTMTFPGMVSCMRVASVLQRTRIELLIREGKAREALGEIEKTMRFGRELARADGYMLHLRAGAHCLLTGERCVKEAVLLSGVNDALLNDTQAKLAGLEVTSADFGQAFRAEYVLGKYAIEEIRTMPKPPLEITEDTLFLLKHFYQRNRTRRIWLDLLRPVVEAADHDWVSLQHSFDDYGNNIATWQNRWLGFYVSPNVGGNLCLVKVFSGTSNFAATGVKRAAIHRITFLMLAIRRYQLAEGHLPSTLDALAPQYLLAVPEDPFDEKPMRWNATKQILYSVGPSLIDHGGELGDASYLDTGEMVDPGKDLGQVYWWK